MFYQLPPAGNPVSLSESAEAPMPSFLGSSSTRFYASGTAALAAAVVASVAAAVKVAGARPSTKSIAEVILPAYGCPDLVSAVVYAGARPVLVDLQAGLPWMDLAKLAESINENTVAIVAVNLFGIAERWSRLRELAEKSDTVLIEDSAQYFPGGEELVAESEQWQGDLVVFSFGRGKPVSLLGGGAVFARKSELYDALPDVRPVASGFRQRQVYSIKARLYNAMISPWLYWLPQSLPFLHLGETRYHILQDIEGMDGVRKKYLPANVLRYQNDKRVVKVRKHIAKILKNFSDVIDLSETCSASGAGRRLLRYPMLVDAEQRDMIYQRLQRAGLGASVMYPASLPEIEGLSVFFPGQVFPEAQVFASRLITLPVHAGVRDKDIEKMVTLLESPAFEKV